MCGCVSTPVAGPQLSVGLCSRDHLWSKSIAKRPLLNLGVYTSANGYSRVWVSIKVAWPSSWEINFCFPAKQPVVLLEYHLSQKEMSNNWYRCLPETTVYELLCRYFLADKKRKVFVLLGANDCPDETSAPGVGTVVAHVGAGRC